jgi:hypothetical protein
MMLSGEVIVSCLVCPAIMAALWMTFGKKLEHSPKRGRINPELKPYKRPEANLGSRPRWAVTGPK